MKYLLDTHAAIWALSDDPQLSPAVRAIVAEGAPDDLAVSDITLFELAMLVSKGRVEIENGLPAALQTMACHFQVLVIDAAIAADAVGLSLPQGDPFDRIIVATARRNRLPLLTRDHEITASGLADVVW